MQPRHNVIASIACMKPFELEVLVLGTLGAKEPFEDATVVRAKHLAFLTVCLASFILLRAPG